MTIVDRHGDHDVPSVPMDRHLIVHYDNGSRLIDRIVLNEGEDPCVIDDHGEQSYRSKSNMDEAR